MSPKQSRLKTPDEAYEAVTMMAQGGLVKFVDGISSTVAICVDHLASTRVRLTARNMMKQLPTPVSSASQSVRRALMAVNEARQAVVARHMPINGNAPDLKWFPRGPCQPVQSVQAQQRH